MGFGKSRSNMPKLDKDQIKQAVTAHAKKVATEYKGKALKSQAVNKLQHLATGGAKPLQGQALTSKTAKDTGSAITAPMDGLVQTYELGLPRAASLTADLFQQLSALAALDNATPAQLSTLHDRLSQWFTSDKAAVKAIADIVRARALTALRSLPPTETLESGTRRWHIDGRVKEAKVQRSGLDEKKVEAVLRARSLDLDKYMEKTIIYKKKATTEALLLEDKVFTPDELATMKYKPEENLALMPSKPLGEEG